ncbi:hypothetical protein MJO28_001753 [Puccinia striiformis f. sp. tritici]|uniref:Uncharacterized protein n=1 Tax=Puccinia striiformis f. sp. tritici TaxID=168172 RepID=A0ACC0EWS9_9BASI|nr:hypothetical protein MJO28_001753 [Puccinia striiformis f. sp. tritici]
MAYPASPNPFNSTVTVTGFSTLASPNNPPSYSQEVSEDEIPPQTSVAAQITWVAIKNPKKLSIKIDVQGLDWDTSRSIIATACSSTYNKIARLFEDGTFSTPCKIDWFGYIFRDSNYPKDPTVLVVDPIAFSVWMNTIISTWACKGGITILMPNPQEKVVRAEKADLVAEVVRRAEARKSLARASTSTRIISEEILYAKYPINTSYDQIYPNPTDADRYILLTSGNVVLWAKAMHRRQPGVNIFTPPAGMKFLVRPAQQHMNTPCQSQPPLAKSSMLDQANLVVTVVEAVRLANKRLVLPTGSATTAKDMETWTLGRPQCATISALSGFPTLRQH